MNKVRRFYKKRFGILIYSRDQFEEILRRKHAEGYELGVIETIQSKIDTSSF